MARCRLVEMSHMRRKLVCGGLVCRINDPRHVGVLIRMFKSDKYGGWTANVRWLDNDWREYVPMSELTHTDEED
jgi:hypothetical protein